SNHALRLFDLAWNRQPKLFHKLEELFFLNHHAMAERHPLADPHHFLEPVEEVKELNRPFTGTMLRFQLAIVVVAHDAPGRPAAIAPNRSRKTAATFGGTRPDTSPPSEATSRIKLELTKELREEVIRQTTSISGARWWFMCASLNS